jgi:hypothetical protein
VHDVGALQGGTCVFIDAEHALDMKYAAAVGVDVKELLIAQPDSGEQALEVAIYMPALCHPSTPCSHSTHELLVLSCPALYGHRLRTRWCAAVGWT